MRSMGRNFKRPVREEMSDSFACYLICSRCAFDCCAMLNRSIVLIRSIVRIRIWTHRRIDLGPCVYELSASISSSFYQMCEALMFKVIFGNDFFCGLHVDCTRHSSAFKFLFSWDRSHVNEATRADTRWEICLHRAWNDAIPMTSVTSWRYLALLKQSLFLSKDS